MKTRIFLMTLIAVFAVSLTEPAEQRQRRSSQQPVPEGTAIERDLVYATVDGKDLLLDVAYPKQKSDTPRPVVVWIHGGAWRAGNKARNPALDLTRSGYVTASISYRFSQEAIWPAQIHDCKAAIRYLRTHAKKFNIDPNRFGVWGSSAGGHLVAMLGTSGDVEDLEGKGGWPDHSSRVQAVVDFFGPTNFIKMCDFPSTMDHAGSNSPESQLVGGPVKEKPEMVRSVDPITYVSKDDPPFLIVHGDKDPLVPHNQSVILHAALKKVGVNSRFITVKGGGHGGWNTETIPTNQEIRKTVFEFFDRHLK